MIFDENTLNKSLDERLKYIEDFFIINTETDYNTYSDTKSCIISDNNGLFLEGLSDKELEKQIENLKFNSDDKFNERYSYGHNINNVEVISPALLRGSEDFTVINRLDTSNVHTFNLLYTLREVLKGYADVTDKLLITTLRGHKNTLEVSVVLPKGIDKGNLKVFTFQNFLYHHFGIVLNDINIYFKFYDGELYLNIQDLTISNPVTLGDVLSSTNDIVKEDAVLDFLNSNEGTPIYLGYDYYTKAPLCVDLSKLTIVPIFGEYQSGKTTLLTNIILNALAVKEAINQKFIIVDLKNDERFSTIAKSNTSEMIDHITDINNLELCLDEIENIISKRKTTLYQMGTVDYLSEIRLREEYQQISDSSPSITLILDDIDLIYDTIHSESDNEEASMDFIDRIEDMLFECEEADIRIIYTATTLYEYLISLLEESDINIQLKLSNVFGNLYEYDGITLPMAKGKANVSIDGEYNEIELLDLGLPNRDLELKYLKKFNELISERTNKQKSEYFKPTLKRIK